MELRDQLCEILLGKHLKDLQQLEQDAIKIHDIIKELPDDVYYINNTKEMLFDDLIEGPEEKYIDSILDDLEKFIDEYKNGKAVRDAHGAVIMRY